MVVSLIVAIAENRAIGRNNDLIWTLPNDMKFFKEKTNGHHVIMGRKNFESIPHKYSPLPNRTNIVITRQLKYKAEGCLVVRSIEEGLEIAKINNDKEPFIIGGGEIYKLALAKGLIDKIYLTQIHHVFEADTFFPELDESWREIKKVRNRKDRKHSYNYDFITLKKIK